MTIKVQCVCGTKYSFEVEPQNGAMPFTVNCPTCQADGTAAANQIIAQAPPRLRMKAAETPATPPPPPAPLPVEMPVLAAQSSLRKIKADARRTRLVMWAAGGVVLIILALIGAWGWYAFVGSQPKLAYTLKLPAVGSGWHSEFLDGEKLLLASAEKVLLEDIRTHRELWSATLPSAGGGDGLPPQVFVDKDSIWVCTRTQLARLDREGGTVKLTVPIDGDFQSFTPAGLSLVIVTAADETRRTVMRVDLASGDISRQEIVVPRAQQHAMPNELPPNVAPTADVLLAQALDEQKFNKPLNAISSEFFPTGQNLIELRVKLLEPKVTWVKSIKPRGPSLINGQTTASTSTAGVEEEVFNDIKRDRTGGVKPIDESRYEVRLRRWLGAQPVEWKGEVEGTPSFFSLPTVDLLVAGKGLTVFDKQNNKLFSAKLSFPVSMRFKDDLFGHAVPGVERDGVLYFFDQGVLTAFSLPGGDVKWRLTSIGINHVQFDPDGMLYVDSTGASPEDIQYSDQIKFEPTPPVIMKVDPHNGKILWQATNLGQQTFLSGKYVYTVSTQEGGMGLTVGLAEAVNAPRPDAPVYFHVFRLDPDNGKMLWKIYRNDAPQEAAFQQNSFILRFGSDVQVWKYLQF